ncbi:MAG: GNAT family N-acetyltransferase [Candidatus Heimdallarchaeota archaeon]|nr:MAG: GNAT family N-acetyltransferase [Candidatus Heimdallarchaeota archaeon]
MTDIKILPDYWNQGLGTDGMKKVIQHIFSNTDYRLLVVPPNESNPAAIRVYKKSGFTLTAAKRWNKNPERKHKIMELLRKDYLSI